MVDLCTHERKKDVRRRRGPKIFAPAPLDRCYDLVSKINNFTSHLRNTECYNPECPCRPQRNQYCPDRQDPVHNRGFYSECHLHKSPYTCPTLTTWSTWQELDVEIGNKYKNNWSFKKIRILRHVSTASNEVTASVGRSQCIEQNTRGKTALE